MPYATEAETKLRGNKMFQLNHPKINRKITLSKIMRLKKDLIELFIKCERPYIDLYSVAHAWVLFERLIYKNVVKKHNRRRYLASCLQISIKLVELYGGVEANEEKLKKFNEDLYKFMGIGDQ